MIVPRKKRFLSPVLEMTATSLLDAINAHYYIETAITEYVQCKINGIQY